MIIENVVQGSEEWHRLRCGVITASEVHRIITPARRKLSEQRWQYMDRLLAEYFLQRPLEGFQGNEWTERGHEAEPMAADSFELITGMYPRAVGFVFKDETRTAGCSPDWMIGDHQDGWTAIAETKARREDNHVAALRSGVMPDRYVPQVQFQLWVTGVSKAWYVSACPPEPDGTVVFPPLILEIEPDSDWQAAFNEHIPTFVAEMLRWRERLIEKGLAQSRDGSPTASHDPARTP